MVLHLVRAVFMLAILALTFFAATRSDISNFVGQGWQLTLFMVAPLVVGLIVMLGDMVWRRKNLLGLSGLFFGLLAGLAIAYVLGMVVDLVAAIFTTKGPENSVVQLIRLMVGAITVFLCVSFVLQTKDDFRFIIPYVEFSKQAKGPRPMVLDTSVIIDGRIGDMAETRVLESPLIIPRFVLTELHAIADSADRLKRSRGRRGLDVLNRLRASDKIDLTFLDTHAPEVEAAPDVDAKLLALAKHIGGRVMTTDYNLNKVAQLRGVDVFNINDLANALKTVVLPGENVSVKIIKPGEEPAQGVGYLDDGTMVVVDQARDRIGQEVSIVVTSMLQTSAGRMIFGRPEGDDRAPSRPRKT
jgi:uncharacterized protein YacL